MISVNNVSYAVASLQKILNVRLTTPLILKYPLSSDQVLSINILAQCKHQRKIAHIFSVIAKVGLDLKLTCAVYILYVCKLLQLNRSQLYIKLKRLLQNDIFTQLFYSFNITTMQYAVLLARYFMHDAWSKHEER